MIIGGIGRRLHELLSTYRIKQFENFGHLPHSLLMLYNSLSLEQPASYRYLEMAT
jgi:hypothetical protein